MGYQQVITMRGYFFGAPSRVVIRHWLRDNIAEYLTVLFYRSTAAFSPRAANLCVLFVVFLAVVFALYRTE